MEAETILNQSIRAIVREELKQSGLTNFNDEMDARADEKLEEFFSEYDLEEKFTKNCERWINNNHPQSHNFITSDEFDEKFNNRIHDVTLSI